MFPLANCYNSSCTFPNPISKTEVFIPALQFVCGLRVIIYVKCLAWCRIYRKPPNKWQEVVLSEPWHSLCHSKVVTVLVVKLTFTETLPCARAMPEAPQLTESGAGIQTKALSFHHSLLLPRLQQRQPRKASTSKIESPPAPRVLSW